MCSPRPLLVQLLLQLLQLLGCGQTSLLKLSMQLCHHPLLAHHMASQRADLGILGLGPARDFVVMCVQVLRFGIQHRRSQLRQQRRIRRCHHNEIDGIGNYRSTLLDTFASIGQRLVGRLHRSGFQPGDRGTDRHPVTAQVHRREIPPDKRAELLQVQFLDVILVVVAGTIGVDLLIGRGHDHHAIRPQNAADLGHHFFLLVQVLDGLERHHDINTVIGKRNGRGGALQVLQVRYVGITFARMRNGIIGDVDTADRTRASGQHRAAVAFAAGHIEHVLAFHQGKTPRISMQMFLADDTVFGGDEAFAGELDHQDSLVTSMASMGNPTRPKRMVSSIARNSSAS
ncbi:hypothetical protein D3C72_1086500 [compost metagenome]